MPALHARRLSALLILLLAAIAGCESLDRMAVGRSDRIEGAPFYLSYQRVAPASAPVLALPVRLEPGLTGGFEHGDREAAVAPLARAMTNRLSARPGMVMGREPAAEGSPWLYIGSSEGDTAPPQLEDLRLPHEEYPPMAAHTEWPAEAWRAAVAEQAREAGAGRVLRITLAIAQFPKADDGWFGKKVVLGSGHEEPIRFLSAVDRPVEVLLIQGLVMDQEGRVLSVGAEGILARDSKFLVQMVGAGQEIDDTAISMALTHVRREDLPGRPLAWEVALDRLVEGLTGTVPRR